MARNIIAEYRLNGTVIIKCQPAAPIYYFAGTLFLFRIAQDHANPERSINHVL